MTKALVEDFEREDVRSRSRQQRADDRFQAAMRRELGLGEPAPPPVILLEQPKRPSRPPAFVELTTHDEFWPPELVRWKVVIREVAAKHRLPVQHLLSQRRDAPIVLARHEAFFRLRTELSMSLPAIGRRFSRDHTTVLHGVRKHAERLGKSVDYSDAAESARGRISLQSQEVVHG